jgi:transposase
MNDGTCHWVGIDLHQDTLSVAVYRGQEAEPFAQTRMATELTGVRKFLARLDATVPVRAVYEAGGCGYWLARAIRSWGMGCEVAAPSLIPVRPGDQKKTDRRDARKLATLYRGGLLELVRVPTPEQEDIRTLTRAWESARRDRQRCGQRVLKFLQTRGHRYLARGKNWSEAHVRWVKSLQFPENAQHALDHHLAMIDMHDSMISPLASKVIARSTQEPFATPVGRLRCLRGIDTLSAMTAVTEVFDMRRFARAPQFVSWLGLDVGEFSSGAEVRPGHITRAGNGRCRRIVMEAAWNNRFPPRASPALQKRWEGQPPAAIALAMKAQKRLAHVMGKLSPRKDPRTVTVAMARELAGFIWAIWLVPSEGPKM